MNVKQYTNGTKQPGNPISYHIIHWPKAWQSI